jgi:hypothetical protein
MPQDSNLLRRLLSTLRRLLLIRFGRLVIPNLILPGNLGSNLILVTEIEIQFVFPDESRKLPRIEHLPSAAQCGIFCHSPPIPGSKLYNKTTRILTACLSHLLLHFSYDYSHTSLGPGLGPGMDPDAGLGPDPGPSPGPDPYPNPDPDPYPYENSRTHEKCGNKCDEQAVWVRVVLLYD